MNKENELRPNLKRQPNRFGFKGGRDDANAAADTPCKDFKRCKTPLKGMEDSLMCPSPFTRFEMNTVTTRHHDTNDDGLLDLDTVKDLLSQSFDNEIPQEETEEQSPEEEQEEEAPELLALRRRLEEVRGQRDQAFIKLEGLFGLCTAVESRQCPLAQNILSLLTTP